MHRRINVFWTLWLSYLVILAIPVVISSVLYADVKNKMVDNANRSNLAMLEQVRQIVDSNMLEIDRLMTQISTHPKLQTLWNLDDGDRYVEYYEAVTILKTLRNGNQFIGDFYIHDRSGDTIITPSLKTDINTYFQKISPYGDYSIEEIKENLLSGYHFKTFWPSEPIYYEEASPKQAIATVATLPMGEKDNVKATLVMLIDEEHIYELLKQIEWASYGSMYIRDGTGQVLMSTTGELALPEGLVTGDDRVGYRPFNLHNREMMLSYTKGRNGWEYISITPSEMVLRPIHEITRAAIVLLVVVILLGMAAAYWMAYRSYGPIRDMVNTLLNGKDRQTSEAVNEYEFIKTSIVSNIAEREQMKNTLADHAPVVRAHILTQLLKDQGDDPSEEQASLAFMGLQFPHRLNGVVLVNNFDTGKFRKENNEREDALARFVLYNLSSELVNGRGYVVETERNQLAWLLNIEGTNEEAAAVRDTMIEDLKNVAEGRFRIRISIAVSSFHEGLRGFGTGYREAVNALDYRIIHGAGSVIYYDQIKNTERNYYHYPIDTEIRLINYLKSGDYAQAEVLLDEVYEQNVDLGEMTSEMGKFLIIDLVGTVIKVMNSLKIDGTELLQGIDPVRHIMDQTSVKEMMKTTKELCGLICNRVREARSDQGVWLNRQMEDFIAKNILDNGLSLTSIADHFGMAPQYISGFFKKHNNVNLTEYILVKRMDEAKRLLRESNMTIMQIAQSIGYANDIGFIRVFKKQEGITPGKYREMDRKAGGELTNDSQPFKG